MEYHFSIKGIWTRYLVNGLALGVEPSRIKSCWVSPAPRTGIELVSIPACFIVWSLLWIQYRSIITSNPVCYSFRQKTTHLVSALSCHVIFCAEIFLLQMIIVTQLTPLSTVWLAIEIHPRLQNIVDNLIDARLLSNKCPSCAIVLWPTNQCSQ